LLGVTRIVGVMRIVGGYENCWVLREYCWELRELSGVTRIFGCYENCWEFQEKWHLVTQNVEQHILNTYQGDYRHDQGQISELDHPQRSIPVLTPAQRKLLCCDWGQSPKFWLPLDR
jgi:hypothetical protein